MYRRARTVPWWRLRRDELHGVHLPPGEIATDDRPVAAEPAGEVEEPIVPIARGPGLVGAGAFVIAGFALFVVILVSRYSDIPQVGRVLVPVVGLFGTIGFAQWLQSRHPDEPWLVRLMTLGVIVKLVASALRYRTLVNAYGAVGDATIYDTWGRRFANVWLGVNGSSVGQLVDLRKSNFLRWFTGVVYYFFGRDIITGFFVFSLIAFIGSYLWYRAAVISLPTLNRKLCLILMLFAPSLAFWPSSIGKEALMQFGLGGIALGTALLLRGRLVRGLVVGFPAAWLVWIVRAHLLGITVVAVALAYIAGRTAKRTNRDSSIFKPIGLIVVALLAMFAITQGSKALGIQTLSLDSVQNELEATNVSTAQGGSAFNNNVSLSPLNFPQDVVTVLLRPFPWEVEAPNQILASLEGIALIGFIVLRRKSLASSLRNLRTRPFLLYCWTLVLIYCLLFQAFGNFGLLVRERSIVLPALYVLLCLEPSASRRSVDDAQHALAAAPRP